MRMRESYVADEVDAVARSDMGVERVWQRAELAAAQPAAARSSARAASYRRRRASRRERAGFERLAIEQVDWTRAYDVQAELARTGRTRAVGIPDLLLAATAERHRVSVLHYDRDFDVIARVTGQPTDWVVRRGTVP